MKYEQSTFQPRSRPTNGRRPVLDRHDLAEQDRRVLDEVVARLDRDRDAARTEVARQDRRIRVEVDRLLLLARRRAQTTADVDLVDRAAGSTSRSAIATAARARLERRQPVGQPARAGVEVDRVDRQVMAPGGVDRVVEPVRVDPELRRPVAAVGEPSW